MSWYRDRKPEPQADGADRAFEEKQTRLERYPQMNSVQQDEMIYHLKKQYELMEKRVADLEDHA